MTDSTTNLLQGSQVPVPVVVPVPRVSQTMLMEKAVKPRHLETGLFAVHIGLDAEKPTKGDAYPLFLANDTHKLYFWDGSVWKSVTFS